MKKSMYLLAIYICAISNAVFADNSVTINNNYPSTPPNNQANQNSGNNGSSASNCGSPSSSGYDGAPQGTTYQSNPHGGTDTVYSTGNKQPYIVDNNCNNANQPMISPYVYPNASPGTGPTPTPTPAPVRGR